MTRAGGSAKEGGFVIVAVLWILVALASLAMILAAYLSTSARALAVNDGALRAEALVSAAVELSAYQLTLADDKARPARGSFQFDMDEATVFVTFTSEAARIDLNFAPKEMLTALFVGLGARRDAASEDADRIVGWRTRPVEGAANDEDALYRAVGYSPRQALFTHVNELSLVLGLPEVLVERALPFVTVFNGSPDVDPAIAAPEVRAALPKPAGSAQDPFGAAAAPAQNAAPAAKSTCYRIETMVKLAGGHRVASEVVIALGDTSEPYRVLSWQDDVPPRPTTVRRRS